MKQNYLSVSGPAENQLRQLAYTEFGVSNNPNVLVCVHGVSRLSRDFDIFAEVMADEYRVVCPDMAGRGESDWLDNAEDYSYPVYLHDVGALLVHIGATNVHWVGTSMGGLIGMMLGAAKESPISRMVINDIGPVIPQSSLQRISNYLATDKVFPDMVAAETYLRDVNGAFGPLTNNQWAHLAKHGFKLANDGTGFRLHYDPKIAEPFKAGSEHDIVLWKFWDRISCPVLVIRGRDSDLLIAETAGEMSNRGPKAEVHTLDGIGHAPTLMTDEQIALVRNWLLKK